MRPTVIALTLALSVSTLASLTACKPKTLLADVTDARINVNGKSTALKVGQRWNYWARPGEEQSTFTVEKIESHPTLGTIVHVGLDNLRLSRPGGKVEGLLVHMPFSKDAIERSAAKLVDDDAPIPPFQKDYDAWKKAVDDGKGSVVNTAIAETLNAMEQEAQQPAAQK